MTSRSAAKWAAGALGAAVLAGLAIYWIALRPVPVPVARAEPGKLRPSLEVPGTVEARLEITVGARVSSTVRAVKVDQRDRVKAGQVLAELDGRELEAAAAQAEQALAAARARLEAAEATREKARIELDRARRDHRRNRESEAYVSPAELDASETALRSAQRSLSSAEAELRAQRAAVKQAKQGLREARVRLDHTRITAPRDSVVIEREAEPGETVQPGSPLVTLVDPDTLWVAARVDETVVGRVRKGQPARIHLRSGATLPGRVARVEPLSDPATRELEVDIAFERPPERLILHEEARVTLRTEAVAGLRVPAPAVTYRDGEPHVFALADGHARLRPVRLGATAGDLALVEAGLEPGARILATADGVAPGQRVAPRQAGDR